MIYVPTSALHALTGTNATDTTSHIVTPTAVGVVTARFILIEFRFLCMVMVTIVVALAPDPVQILLVVVLELATPATTNGDKEPNPPHTYTDCLINHETHQNTYQKLECVLAVGNYVSRKSAVFSSIFTTLHSEPHSYIYIYIYICDLRHY